MDRKVERDLFDFRLVRLKEELHARKNLYCAAPLTIVQLYMYLTYNCTKVYQIPGTKLATS